MKRELEEELFLPVIMTEYTEAERQILVARYAKYVVDGEWVGAISNGRPKINLVTAKSKKDATTGRRKMQKYSNGSTTKAPQVQVCVSHVVLIANNMYPNEDDEASHLCHNGKCVKIEHLVWERGDFNRRRKRCYKLQKCICRQPRSCVFGIH